MRYLWTRKKTGSCRCICRKSHVEQSSCDDVTWFSNRCCDVGSLVRQHFSHWVSHWRFSEAELKRMNSNMLVWILFEMYELNMLVQIHTVWIIWIQTCLYEFIQACLNSYISNSMNSYQHVWIHMFQKVWILTAWHHGLLSTWKTVRLSQNSDVSC